MLRFFVWMVALIISLNFPCWSNSNNNSLVTPFDVSFLLPLPQNDSQTKLFLSAIDIVPKDLWGKLKKSFAKNYTPAIFFETELMNRYLGFAYRMDPCFKDRPTDNCRPQLRITLQYLTPPNNGLFVVDGGIHVFYEFPNIESWLKTEKKFIDLNKKKSNLLNEKTYGVHPHFLKNQFLKKDQVLDENFLKSFNEILRGALQETHLVRAAFSSVEVSGVEWLFQSFDIDKNLNLKDILIPMMAGSSLQTFSNQLDPDAPYEFNSFPDPVFPKAELVAPIVRFLTHSLSAKLTQSPDSEMGMEKLSSLIQEIERPTPHLPGTLDCLSCHAAAAISSNLFHTTDLLSQGGGGSLKSVSRYTYLSGDFIMFGYKGKNPLVSQRVLNEIISVANGLNLSNTIYVK